MANVTEAVRTFNGIAAGLPKGYELAGSEMLARIVRRKQSAEEVEVGKFYSSLAEVHWAVGAIKVVPLIGAKALSSKRFSAKNVLKREAAATRAIIDIIETAEVASKEGEAFNAAVSEARVWAQIIKEAWSNKLILASCVRPKVVDDKPVVGVELWIGSTRKEFMVTSKPTVDQCHRYERLWTSATKKLDALDVRREQAVLKATAKMRAETKEITDKFDATKF